MLDNITQFADCENNTSYAALRAVLPQRVVRECSLKGYLEKRENQLFTSVAMANSIEAAQLFEVRRTAAITRARVQCVGFLRYHDYFRHSQDRIAALLKYSSGNVYRHLNDYDLYAKGRHPSREKQAAFDDTINRVILSLRAKGWRL